MVVPSVMMKFPVSSFQELKGGKRESKVVAKPVLTFAPSIPLSQAV